MEKNIESFFEKKKRDLSDKSKDGDERKKQREASLEMSIETDQTEVFSENSDSSESPNTLLECFKKLEAEVKHLFAISTTTRDEQIKGTGELKELNKSITHFNERIEAYEKEKIEREKQIEDLKEEVHDLKEKLIEVDTTLDRHEQYSRRNCLLLHGIKENDHEDTDVLVMSTLKENMGADLFPTDIDRAHRIGKKKNDGKPRAIIVKFARYNRRRMIYENKKKLKGKGVSITESLTGKRMKELNAARAKYDFKNVWSQDGRILLFDSENRKVKVFYD